MHSSRRQFFLASVAVAAAAKSFATGSTGSQVSPEMFGAKGDGKTNDTSAFGAMSAHITARGGGTIVLRRTAYLVGRQDRVSGPTILSFKPWSLIHITGATSPVSIIGNGASLRCAPGLHFGRFDRLSGRPLADATRFDLTGNAAPYSAMIHIENSSGAITIEDIELDGRLGTLIIGGKTNGAGWLAGSTGIRLTQNTGSERVERVHSHHHAQDGLMLTASANRHGATLVTDSVFEYNGRQGCSITGGNSYCLERCHFRHTGRSPVVTSPGAGVDIEAESGPIREVYFSDCEFSDNHGFGLVSGTGDSANIVAENCRFIGTTNLAAWPASPGMRFDKCLFVGSLNHVYGQGPAGQAAQFTDCTFTDDPKFSPTGQVFLQGGNEIALLSADAAASFTACQFRLVGNGLLPSGGPHVHYEDCSFKQSSPVRVVMRGTYTGTNSIIGNVTVKDSVVAGDLTLNGVPLPRQF